MGPRRLAVPLFSMASNSALATAKRSEAARAPGCRRAGCCPDVLCSFVPHLAMAACWFCQPREFLQEFVWGLTPAMTFKLGTADGAMGPGVDSNVTPSSRRFLQSMSP